MPPTASHEIARLDFNARPEARQGRRRGLRADVVFEPILKECKEDERRVVASSGQSIADRLPSDLAGHEPFEFHLT